MIDPEYLKKNCFPVRLPVKVKKAGELRRLLKLHGMMDQHWFTSGVGTDGFDGSTVGFAADNFEEYLKETADIINLPTIKDLAPRHMASLSEVISDHLKRQKENIDYD